MLLYNKKQTFEEKLLFASWMAKKKKLYGKNSDKNLNGKIDDKTAKKKNCQLDW